MTDQSPQPQLTTVVKIQQQEIERLNNNKMYLLSLVDEYHQEISRLTEVISTMMAEHEDTLVTKESSD